MKILRMTEITMLNTQNYAVLNDEGRLVALCYYWPDARRVVTDAAILGLEYTLVNVEVVP